MSHCEADSEYEESVETHARCKGERFLRVECHHESTDKGSQSGRGKDRAFRHSFKGSENTGVDSEDIRHREERGDTRNYLSANTMLFGIEPESLCKDICHITEVLECPAKTGARIALESLVPGKII